MDGSLHAVNYLHWGDAKRWYVVPPAAAAAFEAAFRKVMPAKFEAQPDLLLQLITMLSPRTLQKLGVPLHAATQARAPLAPGLALAAAAAGTPGSHQGQGQVALAALRAGCG